MSSSDYEVPPPYNPEWSEYQDEQPAASCPARDDDDDDKQHNAANTTPARPYLKTVTLASSRAFRTTRNATATLTKNAKEFDDKHKVIDASVQAAKTTATLTYQGTKHVAKFLSKTTVGAVAAAKELKSKK